MKGKGKEIRCTWLATKERYATNCRGSYKMKCDRKHVQSSVCHNSNILRLERVCNPLIYLHKALNIDTDTIVVIDS